MHAPSSGGAAAVYFRRYEFHNMFRLGWVDTTAMTLWCIMQWEIAQKIGDKEVGFLSPEAIAQTNWSSYLKLRDDHPDLANAKTLKERDDIRKAKCKEAKQKVAAYICNSLRYV
ncbi:hypothetical protein U9M48_004879 [Paspalum notatum var. saurae]|uniref:Uncharacterized protein n=1 Tax=Paspalum notatum var. saurae TaxID=547442 RepID=A0AAQ3PQY1_PASNO